MLLLVSNFLIQSKASVWLSAPQKPRGFNHGGVGLTWKAESLNNNSQDLNFQWTDHEPLSQ